jgi:hypothetical protein
MTKVVEFIPVSHCTSQYLEPFHDHFPVDRLSPIDLFPPVGLGSNNYRCQLQCYRPHSLIVMTPAAGLKFEHAITQMENVVVVHSS